jgi:hypothetical protein
MQREGRNEDPHPEQLRGLPPFGKWTPSAPKEDQEREEAKTERLRHNMDHPTIALLVICKCDAHKQSGSQQEHDRAEGAHRGYPSRSMNGAFDVGSVPLAEQMSQSLVALWNAPSRRSFEVR